MPRSRWWHHGLKQVSRESRVDADGFLKRGEGIFGMLEVPAAVSDLDHLVFLREKRGEKQSLYRQ
jgi:hypothetical protein